MKRVLASLVLLTAIAAEATATQIEALWQSDTGATKSVLFSMVGVRSHNPQSSSAYTYSGLDASFESGRIALGVSTTVNDRHLFVFDPPDIEVDVQGGTVALPAEGPVRTEWYRVDQTLHSRFAVRSGLLAIRGSLSVVSQQSHVEDPLLQRVGDLVFLSFSPIERSRTDLLADLIGSVTFRPGLVDALSIGAGVVSMPVLGLGSDAFVHAYRPPSRPQAEIGVAIADAHASVSTNLAFVRGAASIRLHPWRVANAGAATVKLGITSSLRNYRYTGAAISFESMFSRGIGGVVAIQRTWTADNLFSRDRITDWQQSVQWGEFGGISGTLPNFSVAAGIRVRFTPRPARWPLVSSPIRLNLHDLFPSRRPIYAAGPAGTVDLTNRANELIETRLTVRLDDDVVYRSNVISIPAGQTETVPFRLFLPPLDQTELTRPAELSVEATIEGRTRLLSVASVTMHDRNAWSGQTSELTFFVEPDHPRIAQRAQKLFVESRIGHDEQPAERFEHLTRFLERLGSGLSYVPDATSTLFVDQVRFPSETLAGGVGDCEDLTVLLASSLMAVGIDVAVVDLRPRITGKLGPPTAAVGTYGHVFLLIDTGIAASYSGLLGLNEFQGLTRRSATGQPTIWLPIEPTVLDRGFGPAHDAAVGQYYEAVIERSGLRSGDVQVVDL